MSDSTINKASDTKSVGLRIVSPYNSSGKSFAVYGDTKAHKDKLKELSGKYNGNLAEGPGWIFPLTKQNVVETFIKDLQGAVPLTVGTSEPKSRNTDSKSSPVPTNSVTAKEYASLGVTYEELKQQLKLTQELLKLTVSLLVSGGQHNLTPVMEQLDKLNLK